MKTKLNIILKYGAYISLPMILLSVIGYVFNIESSKSYGWLTVLVFVLTVFFVQKFYRDEFYGGFVKYGKLLGDTMLMLLVGSIIIFLYTMVFYRFIAPEQIQAMLDMVDDQLYSQGLSDSEIEMSLAVLKKIYTPLGLSVSAMFSTLFQGFLISLITCIFNKRKKDGFSEAMQEVKEEDSEK